MRFIKKTMVDAFLWTGDLKSETVPEWFLNAAKTSDGTIHGMSGEILLASRLSGPLFIEKGDYVIKDESGSLSAYKKDDFLKEFVQVWAKKND